MKNKFLSFLGMGKKAGYVVVGETGCEQSIKRKKSSLIIVASDASDNTKKKFKNMTENNNIKMVVTSTKTDIGSILGKEFVAVVSVDDKNFSKALYEKLDVI